MPNQLLEKVEQLLNESDNVYSITLQIAFLAKSKKNIEDLSPEPFKESIIVQSINEIFDEKLSQR